jgi:hypothetical protein
MSENRIVSEQQSRFAFWSVLCATFRARRETLTDSPECLAERELPRAGRLPPVDWARVRWQGPKRALLEWTSQRNHQ